MSFNLDPFKKWFGYNRSERRASFALLIIIFLILAARIAIPARNLKIEEITPNVTFVTNDNPDSNYDKYSGSEKKQKPVNPQKSVRKKIELNSCDSIMLVSLPGIGPVLSTRIIRFRNLLGGFVSVSQLKEVYGLSPETFEMISSRFSIDSSLIKKIKINTAGYGELSHSPYLRKYEIQSILKYRKIKGKISSISELLEDKILSDSTALRVGPYLDFE
jgi:DNA uptake protein ComE-like DNA-binding protein